MTTTLETIRTAYLASVEELIATYPAQEGNRASYNINATALKLGRLTKTVRTKLQTFPSGTIVGTLPERPADLDFPNPTRAFWALGLSSGSTMTVVESSYIATVCEVCGGSGSIQHRDGLVSFPCPSC